MHNHVKSLPIGAFAAAAGRFPPEIISHAVWLYTNGVSTCGSPGLGKNREQDSDRQQGTHHRFRTA